MKKLLMIISILTFNAFANDGLKEQLINKKIQANISNKISSLKAIDFAKVSLSDHVNSEEASCLGHAKSDVHLEEKCFENTERLYAIGDLETIIDMDIAKLTEYQTSFWITLATFMLIDPDSLGEKVLAGVLLPITMTFDLILTPYYLFLIY